MVFTTETFDLGACDFDPSALLESLLGKAKASRGFLIEKADSQGKVSYLGTSPFETLRVQDGRVISESGRKRTILRGKPWEVLAKRIETFRVEGNAPPFATGAVGSLGYEMVRYLEKLPGRPATSEEGVFMLFDRIILCDRRRRAASLVALLPRVGREHARRRAAREAQEMARALRRLPAPRPRDAEIPEKLAPLEGVLGREGFYAGVRRMKEHIRAGDIFQGVLSERFTLKVRASPWRVYRCLAATNPSPYLFFLQDGDRQLIGASPERLVKAVGGIALNCPIAGTRPRGEGAAADRALERALVRSPKERAEHLMLVDLARNDLGRVCAPGSVRVREFLSVRRFSNVMHLVSEVEGRLGKVRAWQALAASFPAGTVSGAPKVRAMEIISELEPRPRGFYAGAVVQHDFSGNLDSCIAIRTLSLSKGQAVLQAGAGIVADSTPEREYEEVLNKLLGLRRALALAEKR